MNSVVSSLLCVLVITDVYGIRKCPKPEIPNGQVEIAGFGRVAQFSCDENFSLTGYESSVCIGKRWSHAFPVCIPNANQTTTMYATGEMSSHTSTRTKSSFTIGTTTTIPTTPSTTTITPSKQTIETSTKNVETSSKAMVTSKEIMTSSNVSISNRSSTTAFMSSETSATIKQTRESTIEALVTNKPVTMETEITTASVKLTFLPKLKKKNTMQITTHKNVTNNNKTTGNNNTSSDKLYIIIALSFIVVITVIIILTVCYKRWSKIKSETNDEMRLLSKNNTDEEREEWSLLV